MTTTRADRLPAPPEGTAAEDCGAASGGALLALDAAERLAEVAKALADPTRIRLVAYVAAVEGGTVCACHLPAELGISQPTLSHHLRRLVDAGVLERAQRGRWAHYAVVDEALAPFAAFVTAPAGVAPTAGCGPAGCGPAAC
ncbi:MAG: helix-turn-helix transcriptional regulator [Microbacteriaceae bacterium]|nr:helix-turn-helix transcriptional regulator [Microbacteriaceae bacterium]